MEHEDWSLVIADIERRHWRDEEAVAKALAIAFIGDTVEWRGHLTHAREFIAEMRRTMPALSIAR